MKKKPSPKPAPKDRQNITKRIVAESGSRSALQIALHGKVRDGMESYCDSFLHWRHADRKGAAAGLPKDHPERELIAAAIDGNAELLAEQMLWAVANRDATALRGIADAVESWRPSRPLEHQTYAHILTLREILLANGRRMTIRRLAELLKYPGAHDDGFRALRSLAEKLHFPIAKARRGRPRIIKTRKRIYRASKS